MSASSHACLTSRTPHAERPPLRSDRHPLLHKQPPLHDEQQQPQPPFHVHPPPLPDDQSPFSNEDFLERRALEGEPSCARKDFLKPRLRYCPFAQQLQWHAYVGHGTDGMVWKAFHNNEPYAVKVFWEAKRNDPQLYYWAPEIECQNAALLEKIRSCSQHGRILPHGNPATREQALENLLAFSDDVQQQQRLRDLATPSTFTIENCPRLRRCYGWTIVTSRCSVQVELDDGKKKVRTLVPSMQYLAIVYEYIEESTMSQDQDKAKRQREVQIQLDFLWTVGFSFRLPLREVDWCGGVMLDMSVLIPPWHKRHSKRRSRPQVEKMEEVRTVETLRRHGSLEKGIIRVKRDIQLQSRLLGARKERRAHRLTPSAGR
ncbi:uncharacterized protein B0I36DRAFT_337835 [Microdochium trichocladiopsis]|uniref:Protein kinase domain-containing protein n=1 Tax=Microdochium trichocladiopsis TaxID=1682393 RepID=A0A9P9BGW6_9PEZI|nr:uncharacterized protein B0I36DRAFT_337835 [Microdochium trichocladiopsis]KAH7016477.1 hypothetical protein B0I36DRAFT_337835 [Microdochium trichocladiopsis]